MVLTFIHEDVILFKVLSNACDPPHFLNSGYLKVFF